MLFETKKPIKSETIYGHLAALKLIQIAGYDAYLGDAARRVLNIISGYVGTDEMCWPSITQIAKRNGVTRAAIQNQVKILEEQGYLTRKPRYCERTGARKSSIIVINGELARQYATCPEIFCKANVTIVMTYLVTLLHYRGRYPQKIQGDETPVSDINKTSSRKQFEKNKLNKTHALLTKRKKLHASAWEDQKKRQAETGVTNEMNKQLAELNDKLRLQLGSSGLVEFSISTQKETKGMSIKAGVQHFIDRYEEKLKELNEGARHVKEQQTS